MLSSLLTDTSTLEWNGLLICIGASLILGFVGGRGSYGQKCLYEKFVITLAVLPVLVQSVIMLVNGNLGTGVAILGAFSLIRFRSVPGGSREIASVFWSMGIGLATGMGYVGYVVVSQLWLLPFY
jgi:hypothetical protein